MECEGKIAAHACLSVHYTPALVFMHLLRRYIPPRYFITSISTHFHHQSSTRVIDHIFEPKHRDLDEKGKSTKILVRRSPKGELDTKKSCGVFPPCPLLKKNVRGMKTLYCLVLNANLEFVGLQAWHHHCTRGPHYSSSQRKLRRWLSSTSVRAPPCPHLRL